MTGCAKPGGALAGGLMDFGARFYDPRVGRFISADPIRDVASSRTVNPYVYCANNPLKYTDKFGLRAGRAPYPKVGDEPSAGGGGGQTRGSRPNDPFDLWHDFGPKEQLISFAPSVSRAQIDAILDYLEGFGVHVEEVPWANRYTHASDTISNCDLLIQYSDQSTWAEGAPNDVAYAVSHIRAGTGTYDEIFVNWTTITDKLVPLAEQQAAEWRTSQPGYLGARQGGANEFWWAVLNPDNFPGFFENAAPKIGAYFVMHELSHLITGITSERVLMKYSPFYGGYGAGEKPVGILFYYTPQGKQYIERHKGWKDLKEYLP